jgi:hypothetical protein
LISGEKISTRGRRRDETKSAGGGGRDELGNKNKMKWRKVQRDLDFLYGPNYTLFRIM